jgi:D-alanine-D-alanine ligase
MTTPARSSPRPSVLVLAGGPDAERDVSLNSGRAIADALATFPDLDTRLHVIDRVSTADLRAWTADVVFPALHGPYGEGGPLQDALEHSGRAYVGCRPHAARLAMDKLATKFAAVRAGVPTGACAALNLADDACPLPFPVVVKPVHEGSSVGVHICRTPADWPGALAAAREDVREHPRRVYMVEAAVLGGRELTVGVLDGQPLAPIEIRPAVEFYDYQAKYLRNDTQYLVDPPLPPGLRERLRDDALRMVAALGVRHLCRVDFLLDASGRHALLEVNTMPGFTSHSLLPKAAAHAGITFPALCRRLIDCALRDAPAP